MEKKSPNDKSEKGNEGGVGEPPGIKPRHIAFIAAGVALALILVLGKRKKEAPDDQSKKPVASETQAEQKGRKSVPPQPPKLTLSPLTGNREPRNLQEACNRLAEIRDGEESSIYDRLRKIAEFMEADPEKRIFAIAELDRIVASCGINREELLRILKGGLETGDTRIASLLQAYLEYLCRDKKMGSVFPDYAACGHLSSENPREACRSQLREAGLNTCLKGRSRRTIKPGETTDEMGRCYNAFHNRMERECGHLPEGESPLPRCLREKQEEAEREKARQKEGQTECPGKKAQELGLDVERVRTLDAQGKANSLAATRLAFLNTDEPPSEEDLFEYAEIMREILFYAQNAEFLRTLGVKDLEELKRKYVDEAAANLRNLAQALGSERGKPYVNFADFLETVWMAHRLLNE